MLLLCSLGAKHDFEFVFSEPGYEFDKECLMKYNHMSFGGPPVTTETLEEADQLELDDEKESEVGQFFQLEVYRL